MLVDWSPRFEAKAVPTSSTRAFLLFTWQDRFVGSATKWRWLLSFGMQTKVKKVACNTKRLIRLFGFGISSTCISSACFSPLRCAGKSASVFLLSKFNFWPSPLFSSLFKCYLFGPRCCFLSCLEVCDPEFSWIVDGFPNLSHYLSKARLSRQLWILLHSVFHVSILSISAWLRSGMECFKNTAIRNLWLLGWASLTAS